MRSKKRKIFGISFAICLANISRQAVAYEANYEVDCGAGPVQTQHITSVFGEARPASPPADQTIPYRFHAGIDVGDNCTNRALVYAIDAGKLSMANAFCRTGTVNCVRVTDSTGHAFDYEHVLWSGILIPGTTVVAGGELGQLEPGYDLHLNDILPVGANKIRVNPQFPNRLNFYDSDTPQFSTATIAPVTDMQVILAPHTSPLDPQPFNYANLRYYVHGEVDIFVTARDGSLEKGVYRVGTNAYPIVSPNVSSPSSAYNNITLGYLQDGATDPFDAQSIYWVIQGWADTYVPSSQFTGPLPNQASVQWWDTDSDAEGGYNLCAEIQDNPKQGQTVTTSPCQGVYIDRTPPTITLEDTNSIPWANQTATSSNTIVVAGNDTGSGVYTITLTGPSGFTPETSTNTSPGPDNPAYSATFPVSGTLADGSYSVTVTDLAGNQTASNFNVQTGNPTCATIENTARALLGSVVSSTNAVVLTSDGDPSGICSIALTGPAGPVGFSSYAASLDAVLGSYPSLASGTYTTTVTDCAGNICQSTFSVVNASTGAITNCVVGNSSACGSLTSTSFDPSTILTDTMTASLESATNCTSWASCSALCAEMQVSCASCPSGYPYCQGNCYIGPFPGPVYASCNFSSVSDMNFTITSTNAFPAAGVSVTLYIFTSTGIQIGQTAQVTYNNTEGLQTLIDSITVAEVGQTTETASGDGVGRFASPFTGVSLTSQTPNSQMTSASLQNIFAPFASPYLAKGSDFVFASSTSISFSTTAAQGIAVDTTTLAIYQFNGISWSSAIVSDQNITVSSSGAITAAGMFRQSGIFEMFYAGHDSSAPVTTFAIQGSSYVFDHTVFVSTYSYAVLTATDPVVNGFASQVATITYCLDPSSGSVFSVYTSSFPLPLGTHVLEYKSIDYAGNVEAVNTATFTVTAGTVFNEQSDDTVAGSLLVGFLGSGAQAEVVARAQDPTTLQISSANHQPMLNVTNVGSVGVGVLVPEGQLDVGSSGVALQLKSGNVTSTGTSVQAAFGYNGDVSMRHTIMTFHSTSTVGNEMDFLVWTPDAGSTTTLATSDFLALQASTIASGGSMHVLPVGTPDAELVVSNGLTTGGGTMQRLQVLTPSSKRFKSDIRYLKEKDEDRALAETAALKHVRFRYKSRAKDGSLYDDPRQQVRVGLLYEDAPDSIRGKNGLLLTNERLSNVELALKAAMRKLERLEKRYAALKARKPR